MSLLQTTTPGTLYTVTFDMGTKAFNTSSQTIKCQVTGSGSLMNQNFSITGTGGGNVNYASKSVSFTANSTSTTLAFSDQSSTGNGLDLLLDNVRLNGSLGVSTTGEVGGPPSTPENALSLAPQTGNLGSASLSSTITPGEFSITMNATVPGSYVLERSEDLSNWQAVEEKEVTEAGPLDFKDQPNALTPDQPKPKMFYRIGLKPAGSGTSN